MVPIKQRSLAAEMLERPHRKRQVRHPPVVADHEFNLPQTATMPPPVNRDAISHQAPVRVRNRREAPPEAVRY
jgi:hypothetical protein